MGLYADQILPRIIDVACGLGTVTIERKRALDGVRGTVLEVGFGSGLNLPHYSSEVTKLVALDPSMTGKKIAQKRIAQAPFLVDHLAQSGEEIPAPDASFDSVVSTFTLCTIPNVERALGEMRRVLKREGKLFFVKHGRAPDQNVSTWQRRLNPIQKALFGGCHLNREMDALIRAAGFAIERLGTYYAKATPKFIGFLYRGVAAWG